MTAIGVAGCEAVNPFPEYEGANILASRSMTLETAGPGYLAGDLPLNGFEYIVLEELSGAEYGTSAGLPSGATVYRLEMLNLLPNGDFEATAPGLVPAGWEAFNGPDTFEVAAGGPPGFGTGNYLEFNVAPGTAGRIDLNTGLEDELVADATYHVQFETVRESTTSVLMFDYGFDYQGGTRSYLDLNSLSWEFGTEGKPDTPVERFPGTVGEFAKPGTFYSTSTGTGYFYVGSAEVAESTTAGYVDNVRIGRVDILPHWAFALDREPETGLPLVAGRYRFRIMVKSEIDSQITPQIDGLNRFRAGQISIGANGSFRTYTASDSGWSASQWAEVVHEFQLSEAEIGDTPALTIQITPSSLDSPAVGSVLISSPVLELVY